MSDIFPFRPDIAELIHKAATDDAQAPARLLEIASEYLRNREALPPMLADYLADAFEVSAAKRDQQDQLAALGVELGLRALNRRPSQVSAYDVQSFVDNDQAGSDNAKLKRLHSTYTRQGITVSLSTLRNLLKDGRNAIALHEEISRQESE